MQRLLHINERPPLGVTFRYRHGQRVQNKIRHAGGLQSGEPVQKSAKSNSPVDNERNIQLQIEKDGFYFSDSLVDSNVSSVALKHSKSVEIVEYETSLRD